MLKTLIRVPLARHSHAQAPAAVMRRGGDCNVVAVSAASIHRSRFHPPPGGHLLLAYPSPRRRPTASTLGPDANGGGYAIYKRQRLHVAAAAAYG